MALCDKWVALKIVEFAMCVACLVAKRVSQDDEVRLSLLLQKLSREWSLLTSVTWDSVGGAFADAVYGGYVIITFGLIIGRIFQEIPKGKRLLEGVLLGFGMLFFLVLGGLELASLDSVPSNLVVNASVLGTLSLIVAALFLIDLMGPRTYFANNQSQTENSIASPKSDKKVSILTNHNTVHTNGHLPNNNNDIKKSEMQKKTEPKTDFIAQKPDRPKTLDVEKGRTDYDGRTPDSERGRSDYRSKTPDFEKGRIDYKSKIPDSEKGRIDYKSKTPDGYRSKDEPSLFDTPKHGYTKFDDGPLDLEEELEKSKFGSLRTGLNFEGGNYIRLSDPMSELHYEQELAKFNENYFRKYLESAEGKYFVKETYLPEPQSPIFSKVKSGRLASLYDDLSPSYLEKRSKSTSKIKTVPSPTLQQLEDYLKSNRTKRGDTPALFPIEEKDTTDHDGRASGTPSDRGYVQYTANKWPDKKELRTPRHSPQ